MKCSIEINSFLRRCIVQSLQFIKLYFFTISKKCTKKIGLFSTWQVKSISLLDIKCTCKQWTRLLPTFIKGQGEKGICSEFKICAAAFLPYVLHGKMPYSYFCYLISGKNVSASTAESPQCEKIRHLLSLEKFREIDLQHVCFFMKKLIDFTEFLSGKKMENRIP